MTELTSVKNYFMSLWNKHTGIESSMEFTIVVQSAEIKAYQDSCFVASKESVKQGLLNMFRQFYSIVNPEGQCTQCISLKI